MVIGIIILAVLCLLLFLVQREPLPKNLHETRRKGLPDALYRVGYFIDRSVRRKGQYSMREREIEEALFIRPEDRQRESAERIALIWILLFLSGLAVFVGGFFSGDSEKVTEVERPAFGEEKEVSFLVQGYEKDLALSVPISGKDPGEEEMAQVFDEAFKAMQEEWLGENVSFDQVRYRLQFEREGIRGIQCRFESGEPEWISDYGYIVAEEIPETGKPVHYTVKLSYKTFQKSFDLSVVLYPKTQQLSDADLVKAAVAAENEAQIGNATLVLPAESAGNTLTFLKPRTSPLLLPVFAAVAGLCMLLLPGEKRKEEYEKRNEELKLAYPTLVSKLSTLIGAGMSIRGAWKRIVFSLRKEELKQEKPEVGTEERKNRRKLSLQLSKEKGKETGKTNYLYEEMLLTLRQMESGISEGEAYRAFGKRCNAQCYRKFGNLLSQNVRQGIAGLSETLQEETRQALFERRNQALRKGEEAGTKLLFPMLLMLGIVIVMLMVPAFMAM